MGVIEAVVVLSPHEAQHGTISREKRRKEIAVRLRKVRPDKPRRCWVFECPNPPGNASNNGLGRYCRKHLEHLRRHGDPLKPSYTAAQVAPYRAAAEAWIAANSGDRWVKHALGKIGGLMRNAGRSVEVRDLRGLSTAQKAGATWARMRDRDVSPTNILAAVLGIAMTHEADHQKGKKEFRQVQIGKALNRMAGGQIKRWPTHSTDPGLRKERVLRWFPASEGLVLRLLGKQAENAAEFLIPDRVEKLLEFSAKWRSERALKRAMREVGALNSG